MRMAISPEAFLVLRSRFVRTHATLSVCHYVLGIGDRHLSNFMVDMQTGGVVGIDFGHAFGSATQVSSASPHPTPCVCVSQLALLSCVDAAHP